MGAVASNTSMQHGQYAFCSWCMRPIKDLHSNRAPPQVTRNGNPTMISNKKASTNPNNSPTVNSSELTTKKEHASMISSQHDTKTQKSLSRCPYTDCERALVQCVSPGCSHYACYDSYSTVPQTSTSPRPIHISR
jgi:hypothetical protein